MGDKRTAGLIGLARLRQTARRFGPFLRRALTPEGVVRRAVRSIIVGVGLFVAVLVSIVIVGGFMLVRGTPMNANGLPTGPPSDTDQVATISEIGAAAGIVLGVAGAVLYWRRRS